MVFQALEYIAKVHKNQYRKGTKIPYIHHLINVGKILIDHNCCEDIVVAGFLHDTVEDTPVTIEEITELFGNTVADIVRGVTEYDKLMKNYHHPKETWQARKEHTLNFLATTAEFSHLLVTCADKLDNIEMLGFELADNGEKVWEKFNAGKEKQKWYYFELSKVLSQKAAEHGEPMLSMVNQLQSKINTIFNK